MRNKILYIISFLILLFYNLINIHNVEIREYGIFIIVFIIGLITLLKNQLKSVLILTIYIFLIDFIIRISINYIVGYNTITDDGKLIPLYIQLMAQIILLILSIGLILFLWLIKTILLKVKKTN